MNLGLLGAMDLPLLVLPPQLTPKGTPSGQTVLFQLERGQSASFAMVSPLIINFLFQMVGFGSQQLVVEFYTR